MRHYVAIAAAAALIPAAANAQGKPASEQHQSFVGPWVEGLLGYDRAPSTKILTQRGLLYGAGVGYDFGIERLRLGVEAEATDSTAKGCASPLAVPVILLCLNAKRDLYVGGRLGAQVAPNILLYAKGGYTNFGQSTRFRTTTSGEFDSSFNVGGFRIGAGIEMAISRSAFVKVEYRYSHYEQGDAHARNQAVTGFGLRF